MKACGIAMCVCVKLIGAAEAPLGLGFQGLRFAVSKKFGMLILESLKGLGFRFGEYWDLQWGFLYVEAAMHWRSTFLPKKSTAPATLQVRSSQFGPFR